MKAKSILAICILLGCAACMLTGCSVTKTIGKLIGRDTESTEAAETASQTQEGERVGVIIIDTSLEKPVFQEGLAGEKDVQAGSDAVLEVQATVNDGGVVSYQWYSNNVASNGGGTVLTDATESSYHPNTENGGIMYYYVLAANNKDGKVNLSTSEVYKVTVWADMYWQQNADLGAYQYISRTDGKYPKAVSMTIDGTDYHFDAEGFAINEEGKYIDVQTGEVITLPGTAAEETPAPEAAPEAAPAEAAPPAEPAAEEAPAQEAPAEEAPAQEAPAEETVTE